MKKFNETSIANEILKILTEKFHYGWEAEFSEDTCKALFEGTAIFLGEFKNKNHPVIATLEDKTGNFHFAGIVTFIPNEEDETKGSYNLSYTFDVDDVKDIKKSNPDTKEYNFNDPTLRHIISDISLKKFAIAFNTYEGQEYINPVMCACADAIKEYMRANVNIDPKLELDDYFSANAEVDGEKVYISVTPSAVMKQHVKDDASTENVAA